MSGSTRTRTKAKNKTVEENTTSEADTMRSVDELRARVHQLEVGMPIAEQKRNELDDEVKETLTRVRWEYQHMKERVAESIHRQTEQSNAHAAMHVKYAENTSAADAQKQMLNLLGQFGVMKTNNTVEADNPAQHVMRAQGLMERIEDAHSQISSNIGTA